MLFNELPNIKGIIVILGSYNNEKGELLDVAKNRLDKGLEEYNKSKYKIILTGGRGEHFNKTTKPHAFYAQQYLIAGGLPEEDILEFVESKSTLEDALLTKALINNFFVENIIIVTSDYHMKRAKYIFGEIFKNLNLSYVSSVTQASKSEYNLLEQQENIKLKNLVKNQDFLGEI